MKLIKCLVMTYIAVFTMTGCANKNMAREISFCDLAFPILIDKNDRLSDDTAKEILTHNLVGQRVCSWVGTKPK